MGEETIEKVLKNFGLTDTEVEVYIFLAKHGVLKCRAISRQMKKDRAQISRILKSLQAKGLVEATIEVPTRYAPVPFEQVIDLSIKAKRDEAALIENAKNELLNYWKHISKIALAPSPERFLVIKGDRNIYHRIVQMIRETKNQLSSISTVPDLLRGVKFGLFETIFNHPSKSKAQFRFLTEVSNQNVNTVKSLLKRTLKTGVNLKGRNPDLGLRLFPRMVIKDNEEIMFFIKPRTAKREPADLCLWTNCTDLVQAFTGVFENLWHNSTDIKTKISEVETGIFTTPKTYIINDAKIAEKKYNEVSYSAEKEVTMMTSSKGLVELWKNKQLLDEWVQKGIIVKIMAPIINKNRDIVLQLSKQYKVRHVPAGYLATTIVDGKHLFQFKTPSSDQEDDESEPCFESTFYTNDSEYVTKTKNMLNDIWRNARIPSKIALEPFNPLIPLVAPISEHESAFSRTDSSYKKMIGDGTEKSGVITETDVLNKIINAKKYPVNWPKYPIRFYGSTANAVIRPPKSFNLPDIMIFANHWNKQSSFGAADVLTISLWLETPKGYTFVPVARVSDDTKRETKGPDFGNALFADTPAGQNVHLVKKDELQIRFHGNTFFAGWTKPIPLVPSKYTLPPACILLEGYGKLGTRVMDSVLPSGARTNTEVNGFDAFVTFYHPASKYSGPGTDGTIGRDVVMTVYPP